MDSSCSTTTTTRQTRGHHQPLELRRCSKLTERWKFHKVAATIGVKRHVVALLKNTHAQTYIPTNAYEPNHINTYVCSSSVAQPKQTAVEHSDVEQTSRNTSTKRGSTLCMCMCVCACGKYNPDNWPNFHINQKIREKIKMFPQRIYNNNK